jgi:hypothetical protein
MRRSILAAIAPLFLLAACAAPESSGQPVQITRAQVAGGAQLAATTLEAAWQGYLASGGKVAPDVKVKVDLALGAFQTLAVGLSTDQVPLPLSGAANDVLAACSTVQTTLPPGTLPPDVVAAITAGEVVARDALVLIEQQGAVLH